MSAASSIRVLITPTPAAPARSVSITTRPELSRLFPQQPQRQDSLNDQLTDLLALANRAGMYDAADFLARSIR